MRFLFDICHPAHFHLFKNVMRRLQHKGHRVWVTARAKDVTLELLRAAGIEPVFVSTPGRGIGGLVRELLWRDVRMLGVCRRFKPHVLVGTSPSVAHVSRVTGARSAVFNEDDAGIVPLFSKITYPFAHRIVTPRCLEGERWGRRHVVHDSYHELAYLHPEEFAPDPGILDDLGVADGEFYSVVRLSALTAHHDRGEAGIDAAALAEIIRLLGRRGRVFVTTEDTAVADVPGAEALPVASHRVHDVLAFASLLVGDSQTMAIEAAMLGVPSVRCNTFVGRISVLRELDGELGLTLGFQPNQVRELCSCLEGLCGREQLREEWGHKCEAMLRKRVNLASWSAGFLEALGDAPD